MAIGHHLPVEAQNLLHAPRRCNVLWYEQAVVCIGIHECSRLVVALTAIIIGFGFQVGISFIFKLVPRAIFS